MLQSMAKKGKLQEEMSLFLRMIDIAFLAYRCHSRSRVEPSSLLSSPQGYCLPHKLKMAPHFPEDTFFLVLSYWTWNSNWRNLTCVASKRTAKGVRRHERSGKREYMVFLSWNEAGGLRLLPGERTAVCHNCFSLHWVLYIWLLLWSVVSVPTEDSPWSPPSLTGHTSH